MAASTAARILAAIAGGYALAYASTACLTLLLPMARSEAVLTASMLSFAVFAAAAIWAFAARTAVRAWVGLLVPVAVCSAAAALLVRF